MISKDVMSPPIKAVTRKVPYRDEEVLNEALTKELNWFTNMWNEERTAYLEAQGQVTDLLERVNRQDLTISALEDTVSDLREVVAELSKPRKRPKRQSKNYKKTSS